MEARTKVRLIGLLMALAAVVAGYFCVYAPLHAAQLGTAGSLSLSRKLVLVFPGFLLVGLWLLAFAPADAMASADGASKKTNGILAAVFVLGCVGGYFVHEWLLGQLRALGYV